MSGHFTSSCVRNMIGTYQRPIQRYHRRPSTTYRLATIQNVTDRRQTDRTSYHKRDRTTQYGRLTNEMPYLKFLRAIGLRFILDVTTPEHLRKCSTLLNTFGHVLRGGLRVKKHKTFPKLFLGQKFRVFRITTAYKLRRLYPCFGSGFRDIIFSNEPSIQKRVSA